MLSKEDKEILELWHKAPELIKQAALNVLKTGQTTSDTRNTADSSISNNIFQHLASINGDKFSSHLKQAVEDYYKTLERAFIGDLPQGISPKERQMAKQFAQVYIAIYQSSLWRDSDVPIHGNKEHLRRCFDDWLERVETGNQEERQIMEQAIEFMQQFARSPRFVTWNATQTDKNHAGYVELNGGEIEKIWIEPTVFRNEICQQFDLQKVCEVLHKVGWLERYETQTNKRWQHQKFNKGRFYMLKGGYPPAKNS